MPYFYLAKAIDFINIAETMTVLKQPEMTGLTKLSSFNEPKREFLIKKEIFSSLLTVTDKMLINTSKINYDISVV